MNRLPPQANPKEKVMKNLAWCVVLLCGCGVGVDPTGSAQSGLNTQDSADESVESVDARASTGEAPLPVPVLKACDVDKECGPGAFCDNPCYPPKACASRGVCRPLPATCGADADCPERFYCDEPCAPPKACAAAPSCQPVPPPTPCSDDSACASGFHCELPCGPDGDCVPLGWCARNKPAP